MQYDDAIGHQEQKQQQLSEGDFERETVDFLSKLHQLNMKEMVKRLPLDCDLGHHHLTYLLYIFIISARGLHCRIRTAASIIRAVSRRKTSPHSVKNQTLILFPFD